MGLTKIGNNIKSYKKSYTAKDYTPWLFKNEAKSGKRLMELPPCTFGEPLIEYFNSPEVLSALHIKSTEPWDMCTDLITYNQDPKGSQWVYEKLKGKYRMLFYSGDTDGAVPTYGSLQWISKLGWAVTDAWRTYMVND
jgi:hypothetical protein